MCCGGGGKASGCAGADAKQIRGLRSRLAGSHGQQLTQRPLRVSGCLFYHHAASEGKLQGRGKRQQDRAGQGRVQLAKQGGRRKGTLPSTSHFAGRRMVVPQDQAQSKRAPSESPGQRSTTRSGPNGLLGSPMVCRSFLELKTASYFFYSLIRLCSRSSFNPLLFSSLLLLLLHPSLPPLSIS